MLKNTLQTIKQSIDMVGNALGSLANNPGLPDIVRNDLSNIASNIHATAAPIVDQWEGEIVAGMGPQSLAIQNAAKILGVVPQGNLDNLRVRFPSPIPDETLNDACCRWSQMFLRPFPKESFDENGTYAKTVERNGLIFKLELKTREAFSEESVTRKAQSLSYSYTTTEGWWTVSGSVDRSEALYLKHIQYSQLSVYHSIENEWVQLSNSSLEAAILDIAAQEFMQHVEIDTAVNFQGNPGYNGTKLELIMMGNCAAVHEDRRTNALDKIMYHFCQNRHPHYGRLIEFDGGHVVIGTPHSEWDSYNAMVDDKKERPYRRDESALIIKEISLDGVSVKSRYFPTTVQVKIEAAIVNYMGSLLTDAEWYTPIPVKSTEE